MNSHKHRSTTVVPTRVLELMESIGPTRAAKRLGVSPSTLYTARKRNAVSQVVEVAAEGALRAPVKQIVGTARKPVNDVLEDAAAGAQAIIAVKAKEDTVVCLLEVNRSKVNVVQSLAKALDAAFITS